MSLLLDALKKSGSANQNSTGRTSPDGSSELTLTELELEELPGKPVNTSATSHMPPTSQRSTGENLFAAKKVTVKKQFHYNLGIVPTSLIIGTVLGTAYGIYVWIEIQPPNVVQHTTQTQVLASNGIPVRRPPPPITLPAESITTAESQTKNSHPAPATESNVHTGKSKQTTTPKIRTVAQPTQTSPAPHGIQIQKQFENDSTYTTLTSAYQAYQNGDLNNASLHYREVLSRDSKNRDALLGMAAIAQQQEQDAVAIQYYRQVLMIDPRDPFAQAGMAAFSSGDTAAKETRLKVSITQSPQSAALHFALGNLYTEQSRWGEAQQEYFNALRLEPANAQFAFNLATSLDHLGQKNLAGQYYAQALKLDTAGNAGFDRLQTQARLNQLLAQ